MGDADAGKRFPSASTSGLEALLDLARAGGSRPLQAVLQAVADAVRSALGYATIVVNVYRPAWHDYEAVLVEGSAAAREALLGTTNSYTAFADVLMRPEFERVPGAFFLPEEHAGWTEITSYRSSDVQSDSPETWGAGDALLVALKATDDRPLGILSVDDPVSRLRPGNDELRLLVAVAAHAALALERAQDVAAARRHDEAVTALLALSSRLPDDASIERVLGEVCATAAPALGWNRAAGWLAGDGWLHPAAQRGHTQELPDLLCEAIEGFLPQGRGCAMVRRGDLGAAGDRFPASTRNGAGPLAWSDHLMLIALRRRDGDLDGLLVVDDPVDRLQPTAIRERELLLLADQAATAIALARRRERLAHLASHDALTDLRNRRDMVGTLDRLATRDAGVAVLLCDLDRFKTVNDRFGHETGDQVLQRFSALLRSHSRAGDLAIRFGGEEFCLLMPGTGLDGAVAVAERLRADTPASMAGLVDDQTVSIGIAAVDDRRTDATTLLAAADDALYRAKAAGRNRCLPMAS